LSALVRHFSCRFYALRTPTCARRAAAMNSFFIVGPLGVGGPDTRSYLYNRFSRSVPRIQAICPDSDDTRRHWRARTTPHRQWRGIEGLTHEATPPRTRQGITDKARALSSRQESV